MQYAIQYKLGIISENVAIPYTLNIKGDVQLFNALYFQAVECGILTQFLRSLTRFTNEVIRLLIDHEYAIVTASPNAFPSTRSDAVMPLFDLCKAFDAVYMYISSIGLPCLRSQLGSL